MHMHPGHLSTVGGVGFGVGLAMDLPHTSGGVGQRRGGGHLGVGCCQNGSSGGVGCVNNGSRSSVTGVDNGSSGIGGVNHWSGSSIADHRSGLHHGSNDILDNMSVTVHHRLALVADGSGYALDHGSHLGQNGLLDDGRRCWGSVDQRGGLQQVTGTGSGYGEQSRQYHQLEHFGNGLGLY